MSGSCPEALPGPDKMFRSVHNIVRLGLVMLLLVAAAPGPAPAAGPVPGRQSLGPGADMPISAEDRCPVCAMLPMRYPRFAAAIALKDGRTYYFCSPGCMLNAWLHPDIFLGNPAANLARPVVREYLSGEVMDARDVFWVSGSDVVGPMGPALVPLKDTAHLEAFRRRHGARKVFRLDELTHDNWRTLTGKQISSP